MTTTDNRLKMDAIKQHYHLSLNGNGVGALRQGPSRGLMARARATASKGKWFYHSKCCWFFFYCQGMYVFGYFLLGDLFHLMDSSSNLIDSI